MSVDLAAMAEIHSTSIQATSFDLFGEAGTAAAGRLIDSLPYVLSQIEEDLLPDGLVVFARIAGGIPLEGFSQEVRKLDPSQVYPRTGYSVEVTDHGFRVQPRVVNWDELPDDCVGYRTGGSRPETWRVGKIEVRVFNPFGGAGSVFSQRLFASLEEALDHYDREMVRECRCKVLSSAWLDPQRVYWKQRPEEQIRQSLEQFLASALRTTVEVEHIVDESKEVDVYVAWEGAGRAALIECKWMGLSASVATPGKDRKITTMTPYDVQKGLKQLADYLDRQRKRASGRVFKGYLVAIDGRRRGAHHPDSDALLSQDALLHYEHRSIDQWAQDVLNRTDIAPPRVMFCRPELSGPAP